MRDYSKELLNKEFKDLTSEERKELWIAYFSSGHIVEVCSTASLDELCSDRCNARICILIDICESDYSEYMKNTCEDLWDFVLSELVNFDFLFRGGSDHIEIWFYTLDARNGNYYEDKEKTAYVDCENGHIECKYSVIYSREG